MLVVILNKSMQRLSLATLPFSAFAVLVKWLLCVSSALHVFMYNFILLSTQTNPSWTYIDFAVSFRCNWLITRRYMLKSLCAITSTVYPHSICLLPNATKVGANVVFTSRLLPLTTSLFLFYAPTVP